MTGLGLAPTAQVRVGREVGVAADHAAEISPAILNGLLGLLREPAGPQEVVVPGEVRPSKSSLFESRHMLPTALREKAVVGARHKPRPVLELDAIDRVDASPEVEYRCLDISAVPSGDDRSVDFISNTQVGEEPCPSIPHKNQGVAEHAVTASVEASSIGIDAPAKAEVGTLVLREDAPGLFLEHLQRGLGRLAEVFHVGGIPRVRRVGNGLEHGGVILA